MLPIGRKRLLKIAQSNAAGRRIFASGLTFIELILVCAIILVLAGLIPPFFRSSFTSIQLRNTTQKVVQLMRYLQAKAISERKVCRINFDAKKGILWPSVQDETSGKFNRLKEKQAKTITLPQGISLSGEVSGKNGLCVTFYPDGSADKAKISICDGKGKALAVSVQRNIGHVEVEE